MDSYALFNRHTHTLKAIFDAANKQTNQKRIIRCLGVPPWPKKYCNYKDQSGTGPSECDATALEWYHARLASNDNGIRKVELVSHCRAAGRESP